VTARRGRRRKQPLHNLKREAVL